MFINRYLLIFLLFLAMSTPARSLLAGGRIATEPGQKKENTLSSPELGVEAYQKGEYKTAYREFRKAAFKGQADSQYNLAIMLYEGKGIARDKGEAIYWLLQSAEQGDVSAQYNLGVLYSTDKTLPDETPKMDHGVLYFEVNPRGKSNMQKAFDWYKKAAEQGHESSQLNLGVMYNQGRGVKRDYVEAAHWYEKAAAQGNAKAQLNLGILYDQGLGMKKDIMKAAEYYRQAAERGIRDAQYNLGIIYFNGEGGIAQDYQESYAWLSLAAEQGSELAFIYKEKIEKKLKIGSRRSARELAMSYYKKYLEPFRN